MNASDIIVEDPEPATATATGPESSAEPQQQKEPTDDDNNSSSSSSTKEEQQQRDLDVEEGVSAVSTTSIDAATAASAAVEATQEDVDTNSDYEEHYMQNNGYLLLRHASLTANGRRQQQQQPRKVPNCCAICLMSYEQDDSVVWSINPDCPHVFHEDCLLDWLVHSSQNNSSTPCPCCRQSFTDLKNFRRERTIRWDPEIAFNPRAVTF